MPAHLVTPVDVARLAPWVSAIREAATAWARDPYLLAALCLRESGAGWAPGYRPQGSACGWGDHGFAFGLVQLDRRWHGAFLDSPAAQDPTNQFMYACRQLAEAADWLAKAGARLGAADLERAALAAYNAGPGAVFHRISAGEDPDRSTAGGDYSRDVLGRRGALRALAPDLFAVREVA